MGLYVTAKEAYEMWKEDPEKVKIIDCRTTEEYLFIGHPPMAWNIPVAIQTYQWDEDRKQFPMRPNPDFVTQEMESCRTFRRAIGHLQSRWSWQSGHRISRAAWVQERLQHH